MSQARDILEAKLALEFEIGSALVRGGLVYIRSWVSNEGRISVMERQGHQSAIERALLRHYARVAYVMHGVSPPKDADLRGAVLTLRHMDSLRARAHRSAMMVLAGIDRDLQASLDLVKSDADDIETKAPKRPIGMSVIAEGTFAQAGQRAAKKLKKRGKALGNVETQEPAEQSRFELVPQADANGRVMKIWNSLMDGRERPAHHMAHGQEQFVDVPFVVGGENLMYPGDTSLGASLGNVINCFPGDTRVSGGVLAATRHWYDGDVVEITTRGGHKLAGTPNHPVLTPEGWVALGALDEGGNVVCSSRSEGDQPTAVAANKTAHIDDIQPTIEQVFDALAVSGRHVRKNRLAVDFHGDRPTEEVEIVRPDGVLQVGWQAAGDQQPGKFSFPSPHLDEGSRLPFGLAALLDVAGSGSSPSGICGQGDMPTLVFGGAGEPQHVRLATATSGYASSDEALADGSAADPSGLGQGQLGLSGDIAADEIVSIKVSAFRGHVYNLQTTNEVYFANGVVVHNCRCYTTLVFVANDGQRVPVDLGTPSRPARRTWHEGDELGFETPVTPTTLVTLNGRTRGRIVLADETFATLRQETPDTVVIRQHGRDIARATISGSGEVSSMIIDPDYTAYGLDKLIRDSVRHSAGTRWPRAPLSIAPPKP